MKSMATTKKEKLKAIDERRIMNAPAAPLSLEQRQRAAGLLPRA